MQRFMIAITVLFVLALSNALTIPDKSYLTSFDSFQAKFGKKYNSTDELSYRKGLYQANMDDIKSHNSRNGDWQKGENMFTDMTAEERNKFLGLDASKKISTNDSASDKFPSSTDAEKSTPTLSGQVSWNTFGNRSTTTNTTTTPTTTTPTTASTTTPTTAATSKFPAAFAALKASVNWVTAGAVSPVRNQGQCGACYAFSSLGLVESLYKQKFNVDINLSEQEVLTCSQNSACSGGLIDNALEFVRDSGVHLETAIPYTASATSCLNMTDTVAKATAAMATSTSKLTAIRVANIKEVGNYSLVSLLTALQTSPVGLAIYVNNSLYAYKSGLYSASNCSGLQKGQLNHAVLAVGYSLTGDSTTNNKPYVLIKNSWGTSWGEAGYFKLEISLVDAGLGTCNITNGGYNYVATLV